MKQGTKLGSVSVYVQGSFTSTHCGRMKSKSSPDVQYLCGRVGHPGREGGHPVELASGKNPVSCDPPTAAPCALPCHGGPVPALPNIWSGRVQSTESRGTGDHLGNTKTNRIWPPSKTKCLGGLRSLMSTPVTVSELQHQWQPKSCIHCKPIYGAHIQSTVTAI